MLMDIYNTLQEHQAILTNATLSKISEFTFVINGGLWEFFLVFLSVL